MKRIAFVTFRDQPSLTSSDVTVVPLLKKLGIEVEARPWDDSSIEWTGYTAVILRSAWNYHLSPAKFHEWLRLLESANVPIWNKRLTIQWNTNKLYLFHLESQGIHILPSYLCTHIDLHTILSVRKWKTIIVKPVVGASAHHIKKFSSIWACLWIPYVWYLLRSGPVIIQKYMKEVTRGEYSLIFFDKKFSHAVKKTPKSGEFRSQEEYGGSDESVVVPANIIKQAQKVLETIAEPLLYTRVDGLVIDDTFYLMELELCEPDLFLKTDIQAPQRFANAIATYVK